jgi:hypothetical protein
MDEVERLEYENSVLRGALHDIAYEAIMSSKEAIVKHARAALAKDRLSALPGSEK